jgi:GNAT superfamily N-acetyltransferase
MLMFPETRIPEKIRQQVFSLIKAEWPGAFSGDKENRDWLNRPETNPLALMLVSGDTVIAYTGIVWKYIEHAGENYKAYGLSGVLTNPAYRRQGYGQQLIKAAYQIIGESGADIGIFTCDIPLKGFYEECGWKALEKGYLVGGTRQKPFPEDLSGKATMINYFSEKARKHMADFENGPIYLELDDEMW